MAKPASKKSKSAFNELGFKDTVAICKEEIKALYLADSVPWVIGYSGGKDSTAVLQIIWMAISELPETDRKKDIHVISTDTLVENPVVAAWVTKSLQALGSAAKAQDLPFKPHRLTPTIENTFWVNLIGRGYPAPRFKFRWCTERLKIQPSNDFIRSTVRENGEAVLVLGTRKSESTRRAATMKRLEKDAIAKRLTPSASLHNCHVYTPIEDWTNDDVWLFVVQLKNPWGFNNKDLLSMYRGASADNECPLVVDTGTPSCGNSRFGCWVCTLVDEDKSMTAMIQNDVEKEWMLPLLKLRKEFDFSSSDEAHERERESRDFRRITGATFLHKGRLVHGPYTQDTRAHWLTRVLEVQKWISEHRPPGFDSIEIISLAELEEIRRIWIMDKHEIEDLVPQLYESILGEEYPIARQTLNPVLTGEALAALKELCGADSLHYELVRNLLDIESRFQSSYKRRGVLKELESAIKKGYYKDEEDALAMKLKEDSAKNTEIQDEPEQAYRMAESASTTLPN